MPVMKGNNGKRMLNKQLKQIFLSSITLILAIISSINVPAIVAQKIPVKSNSPPNDATCYFAGPIVDRDVEIKDLHKSLQQIEGLHKEGKINKETYLKRKEDINKRLEQLETGDSN